MKPITLILESSCTLVISFDSGASLHSSFFENNLEILFFCTSNLHNLFFLKGTYKCIKEEYPQVQDPQSIMVRIEAKQDYTYY